MSPEIQPSQTASALGPFAAVFDYMIDAAQRSVLFLDVMRERGNRYRAHLAETAPHVLDYSVELVADGRKFERPVNYALARVIPPPGIEIDPQRRPFIVVDPRAGHGPGIGGFKADSEIGVALKAGHPCYFIGFLPDPMPGQTIEDIARAEASFIEMVIARHPQADSKPCVIGNCQAGWAVIMLAALRPELFGPIILAGSPLSYWAGLRGQNPMRYAGGLLGGSWLAAFASDLGYGKFDGAWLVQNFENLNPANTLWSKSYNLYAKVDTEAPRYLDFERWWGGHVNLNAEEIQFIVDELFIGNNLAAGRIEMFDGMTIDLRNIRSPIVIFCSKGDNITPPQQALGWILDLYNDVEEIRSYGQTIIYTVHDTVGHLGIFVSGNVARKQHDEFSSNIDLIDVLPPGLYEAVFEAKTEATPNADLAGGDWIMRCEARTLDDIRAMGGHEPEDDRRFATAAQISKTNLALYRAYVEPFVRAFVSEPMAEAMRQLHPLRLQYEFFADANPFMAPVAKTAEWVREHRRPIKDDNAFLTAQKSVSHQIETALDRWREVRDSAAERLFLATYGSAPLQAAAGIDRSKPAATARVAENLLHQELLRARIAELKSLVGIGGARAALARSALYVGMSHGTVDERSFEAIRRVRATGGHDMPRLTLSQFKKLIREQFFMLLIDQEAALGSLPSLLPQDRDERRRLFAILREVVSARGHIPAAAMERLGEIERLFDIGPEMETGSPLHSIRPKNSKRETMSTG
jgi:pimeloyl-ACP methyl ester carboxylesterase